MVLHNLPPQPTPFIGRETELADIARLLADPACRLLTIVGPGGIGKTRLALEAARPIKAPDGVFFVPLQPLTASQFIVHAIADALGIQFYQADDPKQQLLNSLHNKSALLLLDNFEHLLDGVGLLSEMLAAAPDIKLFVTSRERLNVQEEWAYPLEGLSFPKDAPEDGLDNYDAAQLFIQRARQARADFSLNGNTKAVVTICRQLEGLPLGLELAASWLRAMSCEQIAARTQGSLELLTTPLRNIPERHRSLNAVFEQSWNMLTVAEQGVLMRLSVFRGGFDVEASEQVAGATLPVLAALVDKSLVRLDSTGRYDLHELLRQFAADKLLNVGEHDVTIEHFCDYYLKLAEQVETHNFGHEQVAWYDCAEVEWDNLRAAMALSVGSEFGLRMAAALGWFIVERDYWHEGIDWLERMLRSNPQVANSLRAKALHSAGFLAGRLGDELKGQMYFDQALSLARPVNDLWNIAWSLSHLGLMTESDLELSTTYLDESIQLFRQINDPMGLSHTLIRRSWRTISLNDLAGAQHLLEEAATLIEQADDMIMTAWITATRGRIARSLQQYDKAKIFFEDSLPRFREAKMPDGLNMTILSLAVIELALGNIDSAQTRYRESLILHRDSLPNHPRMPGILAGLATVARLKGDYERAALLLGASNVDWVVEASRFDHRIYSYKSDVEVVRAQLGHAAFEQAWVRGKSMSQREAEDYALSDEPKIPTLPAAAPSNPPSIDPLTTRELEILRLLGDGLNSREIADQLVLSVGTVRWYLKQIYSKLGVHGRSEALARARALKVLS